MEAKFLCECCDTEPFVYGNFDPPCYVCRKCGLNVTERVEGSRISESSKECKLLLANLLDVLDRVQSRVVDSEGSHYGCFPFQYTDTCMSIDSPVCRVCKRLHECGWVARWKGDSNARDI